MVALAFAHQDVALRLAELSAALPDGEGEKLRHRLNFRGEQRLGTMWEVVLLHALGKVSPFAYEAALPNGRRPDFGLTLEVDGKEQALVGDITTISDEGLHSANPTELFLTEFGRLCEKHGVDANHFRIQFGRRQWGAFPKMQVGVALPKASGIAALMRAHIGPFLRQLVMAPSPTKTLRVLEADIDVAVSHVPGQWAQSSGGPSYETPYSLHKNPIAPRLIDKANQLKAAPPETLRLIIACDGACRAMKQTSIGPVSGFDIVRHFLLNNKHVDFVLLLSVESRDQFQAPQDWLVLARLLTAPQAAHIPRRTDAAHGVVSDLLGQVCAALPKPIINMESVRNINSPGPSGRYSVGINF